MKNYLFLGLMSSAVFFSSCSSNDDNEGTHTPSGSRILLSKVTTVYYDNPGKPQTSIQNMEYNNQGELIKTWSESGSSKFEYTNGKPSKATYYMANGTLEYYSVFNYNGDQLSNIKGIYTNPDSNSTITFSYNTNGQLTSSTLCQSPDCFHPMVNTYTYNGDNISSETSETIGTGFGTKIVYSYDDKLNPYTNFNKYLKFMMGGAYTVSKNNYLTEKISSKNNGIWEQNQNRTSTIQYNNSGLPVQVVSKEANGNLSAQYNYEYIIQ